MSGRACELHLQAFPNPILVEVSFIHFHTCITSVNSETYEVFFSENISFFGAFFFFNFEQQNVHRFMWTIDSLSSRGPAL